MARGISILGHPLLLMPTAGALAWNAGKGGAPGQLLAAGIAWALLAASVLGYSWLRVRSGAWRHVDASDRDERRNLNRLLLGVLVVSAAVAALLHAPPPLSLGLLLSAAIVLAAMLGARRCKPSLHLAFAVFATAMLHIVSPWATAGGVVAAVLIAWSRLSLQRHAVTDLWYGAAIGAAAGLAFRVGLAQLSTAPQ